jgi:thiamine-monophosphate kinase
MAELAARFDAEIVGGDIVRAPATALALTLVGEVARARLKRRSGGRPGDVIAVTGPLGASRAGLELMRRDDLAIDDGVRAAARAAFDTPLPRVREGRYLAGSAHVRAMMDSSDGLSTDLARLARASGCGAAIEAVPTDPVAQAVARAAGDDPESYALDGGEDFELIVAVRPRGFEHLAARFRSAFGKPLIRVGRLSAEPGIAIDGPAGFALREPAGYEHLA